MTLSLYNTLTRRVEPFQPLVPPRVTLYTCGPTVWNYAHIGNFRTFLFEDLLRRHLEFSSYEVFHIMNLTDVDDRTIKAAAAAGKRLAEWFGAFYGRPQMAEEVSVWGPRDECAERLREVVAAGARLLLLNPVFDELEHLEQFASAIAPAL